MRRSAILELTVAQRARLQLPRSEFYDDGKSPGENRRARGSCHSSTADAAASITIHSRTAQVRARRCADASSTARQ